MHVGRYKRLLSHHKGMKAFPRTCSSFCSRKNGHDFFKVEFPTKDMTVLAGDQWWPRTSGGRLRYAHAITHLLRYRFGHFVNSNK